MQLEGPLKILVVDDEEMIRLCYEMFLTGYGHNVVCIACGDEALHRLQQEKFDLLITDFNLGEGKMDGIHLTASVKHKDTSMRVWLNSGELTGTCERSEIALQVGAEMVFRKTNAIKVFKENLKIKPQ